MFTPGHCPWGKIDQRERISDEIVSVSTPSHGGLCLSPELWKKFRAVFPNSTSYGGEGFLEEDCDWALAPLAFPEMFSERDCFYAYHTVDGSEYHKEGNAFLQTPAGVAVIMKGARFAETEEGQKALARWGKPAADTPTPRLLAGERQGDLITSTQSEPFALISEKAIDGAAVVAAREKKAAADADTLAQNLTLEFA